MRNLYKLNFSDNNPEVVEKFVSMYYTKGENYLTGERATVNNKPIEKEYHFGKTHVTILFKTKEERDKVIHDLNLTRSGTYFKLRKNNGAYL